MAIGLNAAYRNSQLAGANLNQAADTVLHSFYVPASGALPRRLWLVSEAAAGLLSPTVLKLSYSTDGGAAFTDPGVTISPGARARGILVYRNINTRVAIPAGALIALRVSTDAGGASMARIGLDYEEQPFQPGTAPTNSVSVTA